MIIIGVDESGTGAWAGPFTVCAAAVNETDFPLLKNTGVKDSKALSDKRRRTLVHAISDIALYACSTVVEPEETFYPGMKPAWRRAVVGCVVGVVGLLVADSRDHTEIKVVIDGNRDHRVFEDLRRHQLASVRFRKRGDSVVPAVSAASIIAKTVRNDLMLQLHEKYPEYGWNSNYGYGTETHTKAIERFGVCGFHRRIKPLLKHPQRKD